MQQDCKVQDQYAKVNLMIAYNVYLYFLLILQSTGVALSNPETLLTLADDIPVIMVLQFRKSMPRTDIFNTPAH